MASMAEQASEATACLERTAEHLTDPQRGLVEEASRDLPGLAEGLPLVFRHGDYSPRNWLWDAEQATHSLIDFQQAAYGLAVEDLVWLCGAVWPRRPDLKAAFIAGYGRELSETEHRALLLLAALVAASYLDTGLKTQDRMLIDRGRNVLSDLAGTLADGRGRRAIAPALLTLQ